MADKAKVSCLFTPAPQQWGLRGDPFFWEELKQFFEEKELPYDEWELTKDIYHLFYQATGGQLNRDAMCFVEKYAHGGMSSGGLSGRFWVQKAIPLLMERYHQWLYENTGTFFREMHHMDYRYVVEKQEDCYRLRLEKYDDGRDWNDQLPPGWGNVDKGVHMYADADAAKRAGNYFLVSHAECQRYEFTDRLVVWYWPEEESGAERMPLDNLVIYDMDYNELWNLRDFLQREEMCTGCARKSYCTVYFQTFSGVAYELDVYSLAEIRHVVTK